MELYMNDTPEGERPVIMSLAEVVSCVEQNKIHQHRDYETPLTHAYSVPVLATSSILAYTITQRCK